MTDTQTCRHCGAPFKRSRAGTTVHCPAHRTAESRRPAPVSKTAARMYRVYFERPDGVQSDTVVTAHGHQDAYRVARERVPMGSTVRGVTEIAQ